MNRKMKTGRKYIKMSIVVFFSDSEIQGILLLFSLFICILKLLTIKMYIYDKELFTIILKKSHCFS